MPVKEIPELKVCGQCEHAWKRGPHIGCYRRGFWEGWKKKDQMACEDFKKRRIDSKPKKAMQKVRPNCRLRLGLCEHQLNSPVGVICMFDDKCSQKEQRAYARVEEERK